MEKRKPTEQDLIAIQLAVKNFFKDKLDDMYIEPSGFGMAFIQITNTDRMIMSNMPLEFLVKTLESVDGTPGTPLEKIDIKNAN